MTGHYVYQIQAICASYKFENCMECYTPNKEVLVGIVILCKMYHIYLPKLT